MGDDRIKKLEQLTSELEEPRSELDELFEGTSLLLSILGDNGFFKKVSPSWTKLLGWTPEELCSKPWIEFMHPEDVNDSQKAYAERLQGTVRQFHVNRYRTKDGEYKTLHWFAPDALLYSQSALAVAIVLPEDSIK